MRVIAIFPCLCAVVAFMLSILCMFAGNKPGFMQNYDLFTVSMVPYRITSTNNSQLNTSMLGDFLINKTQSSVGGILGSLEGELQTIENDIKNDVNGAIDDIAQALDIHDFYSVHILDYCEGYYEPGPFGNATEAAWKNVTDCSNSTTFFDFDPDQTLQGQLKQGVTLDDLHFPQSVETTIQTAQKAMKAMFILYVIGIACSGLAFIGAVLALFGDGRLGMILNSMIDTASTLIVWFYHLLIYSRLPSWL